MPAKSVELYCMHVQPSACTGRFQSESILKPLNYAWTHTQRVSFSALGCYSNVQTTLYRSASFGSTRECVHQLLGTTVSITIFIDNFGSKDRIIRLTDCCCCCCRRGAQRMMKWRTLCTLLPQQWAGFYPPALDDGSL